MINWPTMPAKHLFRIRDTRIGERPLPPLLSVSISRGVVPRSELNGDGGRADDLRHYKVCHPDDIVINRMSAYQGALGRSSIHGIVSPDYLVLEPGPDVEPRFLAMLFRSEAFVGEMASRVRGIGSLEQGNVRTPRINPGDIGTIPVCLPAPDEQRRIADFLDAETARIDALIAKKRRMIDLVGERGRQMVKGSMQAAFQRFGSIPLRRLVRCLDGMRIPLNSEERSQRQGPYPYFGASGVVDSIDAYLFDETLVLLGEDGAQLGDPDYPIARVVRGKCWVNNHAHVLRPLAFNADLLAMHLSTFERTMFMSGGTREKITQDDMNRIPVPAIPTPEQALFLKRLAGPLSGGNHLTQKLDRQIKLLQEHRQALITAAVTGQLPVVV